MTEWQTIKGQLLASTHRDSQGEAHTRESLTKLYQGFRERGRVPLQQQHDMSLDSVGYIENFALHESRDDPGEWVLTGDIHFSGVDIDEAFGGFSYSVTERLFGPVDAELALYLPYPHYNDKQLLADFAAVGDWISSGAWRKKSADPATVSLVISLALFAISPAYANFWNTKISPLLRRLRERLGDSHSVEFAQVREGPLGETYAAYFIAPRGRSYEYLTVGLVSDGVQRLDEHIQQDKIASARGVYLARLTYSEASKRFEIDSVQYLDGSVVNH